MNLAAPQSPASDQAITKLIKEARRCWDSGDYGQMTDYLERAHRLEPNNQAILLDLGYSYAVRFDFAQADRHFETAIRLSQFKVKTLMTIGHYWLELSNYDAAKKCFDRTLSDSNVPIVTYLRLAEIYERKGQLKDAMAMTERAMYMDSDHEGPIFFMAKLHRRLRNFETAEKFARRVISNPKYTAITRSSAWYQNGAICDTTGRYDEAIKCFNEAKAMLLPTAANALKQLKTRQAGMAELRKEASATQLQRWWEAGRMQLQPPLKIALLCGHARSGTTLLEYVINSHPEVISTDEAPVLPTLTYSPLLRTRPVPPPVLRQLDSFTPQRIRYLRGAYWKASESILGQPIGNRLLIDKNPGLTFDLPVFERIFPEGKIIIALRDPRDVCLSCFTQEAPIVPDSAAWLSLEGTINNYAAIMGVWLALKPHLAERAMEVRYEDTVTDLEGNARRVLEFLGLSWDERVLKFNEHAESKTVCSPTYAEVRKPIYKTALGRWRNYEKYFEPYLEKLEPFAKAFGYEW